MLSFLLNAAQAAHTFGESLRIVDDVLGFLRKCHFTTILEDFGPAILDELRNGMISEPDRCRKHVNMQISRLTRIFILAAEKGLVSPAIPLALKTLAGLKKGRCDARATFGICCVNDAVVDRTLPQLPNVVADMVRLPRLTGARSAACPCDLDQTPDVWVYRPSEHKMEHHEKDPAIAVGSRSQQVLAAYLQREPTAFYFSRAESDRKRSEKSSAAMGA